MAENNQTTRKAAVHFLPAFSGDGYSYGGGVVLTIGEIAVPFGERTDAAEVARQLADLWNKEVNDAR